MPKQVITVRGFWSTFNDFYLENTGELLKVLPESFLVKKLETLLPGDAYILYQTHTREVLIRGRFIETITTNTVLNFLFDKELEPRSSLESPDLSETLPL